MTELAITIRDKRGIDRTYQGSGTVWHDIETGKRPGIQLERDLAAAAWLYEKRGGRLAESVAKIEMVAE